MASSLELWKALKTSSRQLLNAFSHMFRNPSMTNPTIIQLLGDNLPPQSLILLRSLNSLCKNTLHPSFASSVHVKFQNLQQLLSYTLEIKPEVHLNFDVYFSIRLDPHSYLQLSPFFGKYGSQITNLRLRMSWNEEESHKIFWTEILPKLHNLRTLDLRLVLRRRWPFQFNDDTLTLPSVTKLTLQIWVEDMAEEIHRKMENFAELISKTFPNLEDITLEDYASYMGHNDSSYFYKRFLKKTFPFLKGFHIGIGDFETISNLAQLELHLTSLSLQFFLLDLSGGGAEAINQLLKNQSSSLKSLRLIGIEPLGQEEEEEEYDLALQLPPMKNLEYLLLEFKDVGVNPETKWTFATDFNLNEMFPILKTYKLHIEWPPMREKLQEKFIPNEVCLSVKNFDVEYPQVKAEDFKIEGGDENSEERRKKYKDFVTRLTLIFPNAFPKPPPIEGDNGFKRTEEMELVPSEHLLLHVEAQELVAVALNQLVQNNDVNEVDPVIQDDELNAEEMVALIAPNGLNADPVIHDNHNHNQLIEEVNVEEMMELIVPGLNEAENPVPDPLIQNQVNDEANDDDFVAALND